MSYEHIRERFLDQQLKEIEEKERWLKFPWYRRVWESIRKWRTK